MWISVALLFVVGVVVAASDGAIRSMNQEQSQIRHDRHKSGGYYLYYPQKEALKVLSPRYDDEDPGEDDAASKTDPINHDHRKETDDPLVLSFPGGRFEHNDTAADYNSTAGADEGDKEGHHKETDDHFMLPFPGGKFGHNDTDADDYPTPGPVYGHKFHNKTGADEGVLPFPGGRFEHNDTAADDHSTPNPFPGHKVPTSTSRTDANDNLLPFPGKLKHNNTAAGNHTTLTPMTRHTRPHSSLDVNSKPNSKPTKVDIQTPVSHTDNSQVQMPPSAPIQPPLQHPIPVYQYQRPVPVPVPVDIKYLRPAFPHAHAVDDYYYEDYYDPNELSPFDSPLYVDYY